MRAPSQERTNEKLAEVFLTQKSGNATPKMGVWRGCGNSPGGGVKIKKKYFFWWILLKSKIKIQLPLPASKNAPDKIKSLMHAMYLRRLCAFKSSFFWTLLVIRPRPCQKIWQLTICEFCYFCSRQQLEKYSMRFAFATREIMKDEP